MRRPIACRILAFAAALVPVFTGSVGAQNRPAMSLSGGARMYDADGAESMVTVAIRSEIPMGGLVLELAGSVADPAEGAELSTASVFEAQVQLPIPLGETLTPYVGAGGGFAKTYTGAKEDEEFQTALSASAGVKWALAERLGLVVDARVRGIGTDFAGTHTDLTVGLRYQFGRRDRPRFRGAPRPRS
ncbi:MAG TPA: outer membrane beta-barrel protein [Longimicrobium sp.]|nr:outer membrane beta-barrel protein [Longimicrobium sp.]